MGLPIITVSRQYGSAGRDVARQVAETVAQIPYYDKEVISMTAAQTGFSEEVVRNEEMKRSVLGNPLFSLTHDRRPGVYDAVGNHPAAGCRSRA